MAIPRVFVSSTCYDLKYIRENLKFFIKTLGYEPILSEDGDVFYNPRKHTHDSCISEVSSCQIFVLIIGGRYGGKSKDTDKSITNMEYKEAISLGIPIFALVESSVYSEHNVYNENIKNNSKLSAKDINYPSVDNVKVFDFIDEVRKNIINNAIYPFSDFSDIESYLKKQWAGMMHFYITSETEAKRVSQLFESIQEATSKIEFLTRQMAGTIGNDKIKLTIDLYDMMVGHEIIRDLSTWNIKISPKVILENNTVDDLCLNKIVPCDREGEEYSDSITLGGPPYNLTTYRYKKLVEGYTKLRESLLGKLQEVDLSVEDFLRDY